MNDFTYNYYIAAQKQTIEENEKKESLINNLSMLNDIQTLDEARDFLSGYFSIKNEYSNIYLGDTCFTIINKPNSLRLTIDGKDEFSCFVYE